MKNIVIHHTSRNPEMWTFSGSGKEQPSFRTISEATQAAIDWATRIGEDIEVTGHADREKLRSAGIRYIDSRDNDRRGEESYGKQHALGDLWRDTKEGKVSIGEFTRRAKTIFNIPAATETEPVTAEKPAGRTPAQLAALAAAREKREIASPRIAPDGYRSVDHFLDDVREYIGRGSLTMELARYLNVNESSIRKWIKKEKIPTQKNIDAINAWRIGRKS